MTTPNTTLLECEYFPCIAWYQTYLRSTTVIIEQFEFFERTSFRNRCEVIGPNGKITLSIPLHHGRNQRTLMKDVKICHKEPWQQLHWKTLCSSYRRTPYFEYYEETLRLSFEKRFDFLMDMNLHTLEVLNQLFKVSGQFKLSTTYEKNYNENVLDCRKQFSPGKNPESELPVYTQNFEERNGFITNLSVLDMLFSCGPDTLNRLK